MNPTATFIFTRHNANAAIAGLFLLVAVMLQPVQSTAQWSLCNPVGYSPRQTISVTDNNTVFTAGNDGKVWKSLDHGSTWSISNTDTTKSILGMCFLNQDTGFVCGVAGKMFKTTDGGNTWSSVNSGAVVDLYDIEFVNATTGFVIGLNGTIRKTTNGGLSWSAMSSNTTAGLLAIDMVSATSGFITGSNGTILSTVNGTSWSQQSSNIISAINDVRSLDGTNAYACGSDARFLFTRNGGSTWQASYLDLTYPDFYSIDFIDNDTGWICGQYGKVHSTTDGGISWNLEASSTGSLLLDLKASASCRLFVCGTGGTVISKNCNSTDIGSPEKEELMAVFPNPVKDLLNVNLPNGVFFGKISITDITGVVVIEKEITEWENPFSMDISWIPNGFYFLNFSGDCHISKKIILEK
ncbi:MAG: YCF48-related protein [Bacteroidota bacterium]